MMHLFKNYQWNKCSTLLKASIQLPSLIPWGVCVCVCACSREHAHRKRKMGRGWACGWSKWYYCFRYVQNQPNNHVWNKTWMLWNAQELCSTFKSLEELLLRLPESLGDSDSTILHGLSLPRVCMVAMWHLWGLFEQRPYISMWIPGLLRPTVSLLSQTTASHSLLPLWTIPLWYTLLFRS